MDDLLPCRSERKWSGRPTSRLVPKKESTEVPQTEWAPGDWIEHLPPTYQEFIEQATPQYGPTVERQKEMEYRASLDVPAGLEDPGVQQELSTMRDLIGGDAVERAEASFYVAEVLGIPQAEALEMMPVYERMLGEFDPSDKPGRNDVELVRDEWWRGRYAVTFAQIGRTAGYEFSVGNLDNIPEYMGEFERLAADMPPATEDYEGSIAGRDSRQRRRYAADATPGGV